MQVVRKKKKPYMAAGADPWPELHKCMPCGYIYDDGKMNPRFDELTERYRCPLCNAGKDAFLRINTGG